MLFFISFYNFCFKSTLSDVSIAFSLSFPFHLHGMSFFFSSLFPFPFFVSIWPLRTCLVLLQSSLILSSVLSVDFSFFCSACVISTALSSSLLICSSVGFTLLLIPHSFFFISVTVFFFSGSSLYFLLKTSYFLLCSFIILPRTLIFSTIITFFNFYFYFILLYNTVLVLPFIHFECFLGSIAFCHFT